jgi:site-specific recombinase XerD
MEELMNIGETTISIIKKGDNRSMLFIGAKGKQLFHQYQNEFNTIKSSIVLTSQSPKNAFFFSSRKEPDKPLCLRNLDRQINKILIVASTDLGNFLRSHSFRASFITDLLKQETPIETVKDIIGHSNIGTTATYRRSRLRAEQAKTILKNLATARLNLLKTNKSTHKDKGKKLGQQAKNDGGTGKDKSKGKG